MGWAEQSHKEQMDRTPSFGGQGYESCTHPGLGDRGGTGRRLMEMPAGTHRDHRTNSNVMQGKKLEKQLKGMFFTPHFKSQEK